MDSTWQASALWELLDLKQDNRLFLDEEAATSPVAAYLDSANFETERARIFRTLPGLLAHASELAEPNSFLRCTVQGLPLLVVRGDDGCTRTFLNVCRHRGTRLVDDHSGCRRRFTCPYHAWTWNNRGQFVGGPHLDESFPDTNHDELGLRELPCIERHGFIWLAPNHNKAELTDFLGALDKDLAWAGTEALMVHQSDEQLRRCNWKLIAEGGLEAYHFRVAHRNTIGKLFNDSLSSYKCVGPHIRSVLPRSSIRELALRDQESWALREHANILYTIFPTSMLLVQSDHVIWIRLEPMQPDLTGIRIVTLKPRQSPEPDDYWNRNHALTVQTLNEDFDLGESIQSGLPSGANEALRFGRLEGALHQFNETVRKYSAEDPPP